MPVRTKPSLGQPLHRLLGQIAVLKATSSQRDTRLSDPACYLNDDLGKRVVKHGRNRSRIRPTTHIIKNLPDHRLPIDNAGLTRMNDVIVNSRDAGRCDEFKLHRGLALKRDAPSYSGQISNRIKQTPDARSARR